MRPDLDETLDLSNPDAKRRLLAWLSARSGLYAVSAEPKRDTRSLRQNAYFWSCYVAPFHDWLIENDVKHMPGKRGRERAKRLLVAAVMGVVEDVCPVTGHVFEDAPHTSDMTLEAFADMLDRMAVWLAENTGVVVQEANPFRGDGAAVAGRARA